MAEGQDEGACLDEAVDIDQQVVCISFLGAVI
jgi:hypothetical protein